MKTGASHASRGGRRDGRSGAMVRGRRRAAGARQRGSGQGYRCRGGVGDGGVPDTAGMANEVVVARSQRNMYDRAVVQAGARLVEVGIPDRFSGAGVRDAQSWEYEAAINDKTAAILWVAQDHSEPRLPEIVTLARRHKLPVIVDAAGQLPPAEN